MASDEYGFERPFASQRVMGPGGMKAPRAAEMLASIAEEADLGTVRDHPESPNDLIRMLDYGSLAFDCMAAFDSHGCHGLERPSWMGDAYLRAKVWFGEEIKNDPEASALRPGDTVPSHIEVLVTEEKGLINREPDVSPGTEWRAVLRVPADLFEPIYQGGIRPPEEESEDE